MAMIRLNPSAGTNYIRQFFTKDFWDSVGVKLVATFISVKVWALLFTWVASSVFLVKHYIAGGEWVTINGTITSIVMGMREIFKIASIKQYMDDGSDITQK